MKRWTQREVNYIKQGMSDLEIMQLTGRSAMGVVRKRKEVTEDTEGDEGIIVPPSLRMTKAEKIERIKTLAERYGVKLLG